VMGLPASICCQCRAEKPNPIMSSCVYPLDLRNFFIRKPKARKNCLSSITPLFVEKSVQKYHEQISWVETERTHRCVRGVLAGEGGVKAEMVGGHSG
jgi:hypothetical protein